MGLGFNGPIKTLTEFVYIVFPLFCLPLFILFLVKPRWGFYAFASYYPLWWLGMLAGSFPDVTLDPLPSGLAKMMLACSVAVCLSYLAYTKGGKIEAR